MKRYDIKGSCEMCGFAYKGKMITKDGIFTSIHCQQCGIETHNFDEAHIVDENDKVEHYNLNYKSVSL